MNADLSVAPEIAQLALPMRAGLPPHPAAVPAPPTTGRRAGELARLAAAPQRWWDLVRFDPDGPVRVPVPGSEGAWLLVLPPGATAECDCGYGTLLAGEAAESTAASAECAAPAADGPARPLHAGRVRVRGRRAALPAGADQAALPAGAHHPAHRIRGGGHGYSVTLHAADGPARSEEDPDLYPERSVATLHPAAVPPGV